ncbi:MAG: (p)ppGpp synthetase [Treponema sp.]|nr:(p)ppGpp synthetase [Treponema sp.]
MKDIVYDTLPLKAQIQKTYELYVPYLAQTAQNIEKLLEKNIVLASQPTYKVRIKAFRSYYKKILRLKMQNTDAATLVCLTDMMGIRIICAFLEDTAVVLEQLKQLFEIKEIERKGPAQNFKEFEYESTHILVKIPQSCLPDEKDFAGMRLPDAAVCEIQIRTILQDAWAEVEHELVYKSEFSPFDLPLRRKLASINASLTLADIIFQEIRDYQKKLQGEVNERRRIFYEKVDELDVIKKEVQKTASEKIGRVSMYVKGTIDDLLLDAIHAHNDGNLLKAIEIYTQIIEASPPAAVLSVIHKHRGMAYFTESEYENALEDFKASSSYDAKNFRALYYEGIVHSILKDNKLAIKSFSKSLAINEYQSHAFYRRAEAYYEEGEYDKALADVIAAKKLGMNDETCNVLHAKVMEKL